MSEPFKTSKWTRFKDYEVRRDDLGGLHLPGDPPLCVGDVGAEREPLDLGIEDQHYQIFKDFHNMQTELDLVRFAYQYGLPWHATTGPPPNSVQSPAVPVQDVLRKSEKLRDLHKLFRFRNSPDQLKKMLGVWYDGNNLFHMDIELTIEKDLLDQGEPITRNNLFERVRNQDKQVGLRNLSVLIDGGKPFLTESQAYLNKGVSPVEQVIVGVAGGAYGLRVFIPLKALQADWQEAITSAACEIIAANISAPEVQLVPDKHRNGDWLLVPKVVVTNPYEAAKAVLYREVTQGSKMKICDKCKDIYIGRPNQKSCTKRGCADYVRKQEKLLQKGGK